MSSMDSGYFRATLANGAVASNKLTATRKLCEKNNSVGRNIAELQSLISNSRNYSLRMQKHLDKIRDAYERGEIGAACIERGDLMKVIKNMRSTAQQIKTAATKMEVILRSEHDEC